MSERPHSAFLGPYPSAPFPSGPAAPTFDELASGFRWWIPERFNIGVTVADEWALREPDRTALIGYRPDGGHAKLTYAELARMSAAFASALAGRGVGQGDRVALLLPQGFETVVAHVACYKLGAIVVPLALLFGVEALEFRLQTAGAKAIVGTAAGLEKIGAIAMRLPTLELLIAVDGACAGAADFHAMVAEGDASFVPVDTGPDDPAMMIFTSGTTGPPKGAVLPHRVLLGHMPGFCLAYEFPPQPDDLMWTPADWA